VPLRKKVELLAAVGHTIMTEGYLDRILQHRHSISEEQAYLDLRRESRRLRRPMRDLAEAIVLAEELHRKGEKD